MRISDWRSDVCSSDLHAPGIAVRVGQHLERGVDQRPTGLARNVLERIVGKALRPVRGREFSRTCGLRSWRCERGHSNAQIGRAHVLTPVTNAPLVCRLLLDKKKYILFFYQTSI